MNKIHKKILVYISHPSGGKEENTRDTEELIRELYKNEELYNNFCFVSPIHCYGFMYNDVEYYKGLSFCTDLLNHCKFMLLFGDWEQSKGCTAEKELCDIYGIPYIEIKDMVSLKDNINNGLCEKMLELVDKNTK